jgi:NADPH:quinone reductase-like Zn-dependent oxidoreductase
MKALCFDRFGDADVLEYRELPEPQLTPDTNSAFRGGQRVAFADSPHANAELVVVPEDKLIALPDDMSFDVAAAVLLQGLTCSARA